MIPEIQKQDLVRVQLFCLWTFQHIERRLHAIEKTTKIILSIMSDNLIILLLIILDIIKAKITGTITENTLNIIHSIAEFFFSFIIILRQSKKCLFKFIF